MESAPPVIESATPAANLGDRRWMIPCHPSGPTPMNSAGWNINLMAAHFVANPITAPAIGK